MLLLRSVHYVLREGSPCQVAHVYDHGIDTADLDVYLDTNEVMEALFDGRSVDVPLVVKGAAFDAAGAVGTWHIEDGCPRREKE